MELSSKIQVTRMGHCLALGVMPAFILCSHSELIINSLICNMEITPETLKWAESRRDSIKALTSVCVTLQYDIGGGL